jgi:hypothetical protein
MPSIVVRVPEDGHIHAAPAPPPLGILEERCEGSADIGGDHALPALTPHASRHIFHDNEFALHPHLLRDAAPLHLLAADIP